MIIAEFLGGSKAYSANYIFFFEEQKLKITDGKLMCPACDGKLAIHGYCDRITIDFSGLKTSLLIMRVICHSSGCEKTHVILPEFIMPHKHYSGEVIEHTLYCHEPSRSISECMAPAEISTIDRWRMGFKKKGLLAVKNLQAIFFVLHGAIESMVKFDKKTLLERIYILVRLFFKKAGLCGIIGKANIILTAHGSGFI